jgi:uncharacterized protein
MDGRCCILCTEARQNLDEGRKSLRKLNAAAAILTIVGGLNWGLVGLFKFDLVAAVFGGMQFGEVNVGSRVVYTLVGLSALYLASQLRTLVGTSQPSPANSISS